MLRDTDDANSTLLQKFRFLYCVIPRQVFFNQKL